MIETTAAEDFVQFIGDRKFSTILADPPWQFQNRTGKMAPEHKRLSRYPTLDLQSIKDIPVQVAAEETAHLYLWVPNALLPEGLAVMDAWGFQYKSNIIWYKIRKDGGPDGRGVGFYFRNVTEILLFGVRGKGARTLQQGRSQTNIITTRKREHSRKPDEQYDLIEGCSWGPRLELFSRGNRRGWTCWGNQADEYNIEWETYKNHSQREKHDIKQLTLMEPKVININPISKKKAK
jgi:N6-adenosine-specific RNA methylase IME4